MSVFLCCGCKIRHFYWLWPAQYLHLSACAHTVNYRNKSVSAGFKARCFLKKLCILRSNSLSLSLFLSLSLSHTHSNKRAKALITFTSYINKVIIVNAIKSLKYWRANANMLWFGILKYFILILLDKRHTNHISSAQITVKDARWESGCDICSLMNVWTFRASV